MIRWKILKQSIKLLLAIPLLVSCSEKKSNSGQDIFLEISERKEFKIGWDGLFHNSITPVALNSLGDKGLIYNYLNHSIDSIFFSKDSAWSKTGDPMEYEGPFGVGRINSFFAWGDTLVLFTGSEFFFKSIKTGEVKKKLLLNYPFFKDRKFYNISHSGGFENRFLSFDERNQVAYFIISNPMEEELYPVRLNLKADFFETVPVFLDSIKLHEFSYTLKINNGGLVSGLDNPSMTMIENELLITYPAYNDLLQFDTNEETQQKFSPMSINFPAQRDLPRHSRDNLEIDQALKLLDNWQNQVTFGPMGYWKDFHQFFRFVTGPREKESEKSGSIYFELFSDDLKKIGEQNISQLNPDLSRQYIQTKYGLMVKALDQPKEDVMYFYYLNINRSK